MRIEWSDELELGIPEIDEQHRRLVDLIGRFYTESEETQKAERFLAELEDYLNYHLSYEEAFMERIGFLELPTHREAHNMFKKIFAEKKEAYEKGDKKALRELAAFAFAWLYSHIKKVDRKYAEYYRESAK